jgi:XapX domain-containing protein
VEIDTRYGISKNRYQVRIFAQCARIGARPKWRLSMKTALGFLLAFAIGAVCRWIEIPLPAPPRLTGALLVVAITVGFLAADRLLAP